MRLEAICWYTGIANQQQTCLSQSPASSIRVGSDEKKIQPLRPSTITWQNLGYNKDMKTPANDAVQDFHNLCVPSFLIHTLPFFLSRMKAFVNFLYGNSSLQLVSSLENNLRVIWLISIPSGASGNSFALLSVMFGRLLMIVLREEIYNQSNDLIKHAAQHEHTEIGVIRTWLFYNLVDIFSWTMDLAVA